MPVSFSNKIGAALAIGLGLALVLVAGGYFAFVRFGENNRLAIHTQQVLMSLRDIESNLLAAESAQRGYLLTGSRNHLLSYERAHSEANVGLATLLKLVADVPQQVQSRARLQQLVGGRLDASRKILEIHADRGQAAALALLGRGDGDHALAELQTLSQAIAQRQSNLLSTGMADGETTFHQTMALFVVAILFYVVFMVVSIALIRQELYRRRLVRAQLRESEARLRAITDSLPALITYVDCDERFRFCNQHIEAVFARAPESLMGATMLMACGPSLYADLVGHVRKALQGEAVSFDGSFVTRNRTMHHHSKYVPDRTADGIVRGFYAISFDITARKAAEDELFEEHERMAVTLRSIGDAVVTTDEAGLITYLNPAAELMTGFADSLARGQPLEHAFRLIDGKTRLKAVNPLEQSIRENRAVERSADALLIRNCGAETAIEHSAAPIRDRAGNVAGGVVVFHDVSEVRALAARMARMAHHDALTDLPNRLLLKDRIAQAIGKANRNQSRLAVLFCDLDRFKQVNDRLGHGCGDALLKQVARRLVAAVRGIDTVSRQGGDEFVILLHDVPDAISIAAIVEKIRATVGAPYMIADQTADIGITIGISTYPDDGTDEDALLQNADTAMYQAKAAGGGEYQFFTAAMNLHTQQRFALESDLRDAIANHQFTLYYQPKVNFATGAIVGAEALIRWPYGATKGHTPGSFIRFAEETGLITYVGFWVLQEACMQVRVWQALGLPPIPISVNVSALQLRQKNFAEDVSRMLAAMGVHPNLIELELMENMLIDADADTIAQMHALRRLGVRLAIDDFGTGYSSLNYLAKFPVDILKIDQSFVREITTARHSEAISLAIITLAQLLDLDVVAEGIETTEQAALLSTLGCEVMQGFLFAKPLLPDEFAALLRKSSTGDPSKVFQDEVFDVSGSHSHLSTALKKAPEMITLPRALATG